MLTGKKTVNTFGGTVTKRQFFRMVLWKRQACHIKKVRNFPMLCLIGHDHMETTAFQSNWVPMGLIVAFDRRNWIMNWLWNQIVRLIILFLLLLQTNKILQYFFSIVTFTSFYSFLFEFITKSVFVYYYNLTCKQLKKNCHFFFL